MRRRWSALAATMAATAALAAALWTWSRAWPGWAAWRPGGQASLQARASPASPPARPPPSGGGSARALRGVVVAATPDGEVPLEGVRIALLPALGSLLPGAATGCLVTPGSGRGAPKPCVDAAAAVLRRLAADALSWEVQRETRTGADGAFVLEPPEGGAFLLLAERGGLSGAWDGVVPGTSVQLFLQPAHPLRGQVVDEEGEPLAGAQVWLVQPHAPALRQALTDAQGGFHFAALGSVHAVLAVAAAGFEPALVPVGPATLQQVVLARVRRLAATVVLAGQPVAGARVEAQGGALQATSGGDGRVLFEDVPEGPMQVRAQWGGHLGEATLLPDVPGLIELAPPGALQVRVRAPRRSRLPADTRVHLQCGAQGEEVAPALARRGTWRFEGLPRCDYTLRVGASGFAAVQQVLPVAGGRQRVQVSLEPVLAVRGRVVDEAGQPQAGVELRLTALEGAPAPRGRARQAPAPGAVRGSVHTAVSGAEGRFDVEGLTAGTYALQVEPGRPSPWEAEERQVAAPAGGLTLVLRRGARLHGRLVAEGAARLPDDVTLEVRRLPFAPEWPVAPPRSTPVHVQEDGTRVGVGPEGHWVQLSPDGSFAVPGLAAGDYLVRAGARGYLEASAAARLERGGEARVELGLARGLSLEGSVVYSWEEPVAGAQVTLERVDGQREEARADVEGRFRFEGLAPGPALLAAALDGVTSRPLRVEAGAGAPVRLVLPAAGRVRGRLVDRSGTPVTDYLLNGTPVRAADGHFETAVSAEGRAELFFSGPFASRLVKVRVEEGGEKDLGEVRVERGTPLRGRVRDAAGRPVADCLVAAGPDDQRGRFSPEGALRRLAHWSPEGARRTVCAAEAERAQTTFTDAQGRFELPSARMGVTVLDVQCAEGVATQWLGVGGRPMEVDVTLGPGATLALEVPGAVNGRVLLAGGPTLRCLHLGPDGRGELRGVAPGIWSLWAVSYAGVRTGTALVDASGRSSVSWNPPAGPPGGTTAAP